MGKRLCLMALKQRVKDLLIRLNLPVTRNLKYDIFTLKIMQKVLKPSSNSIDIGCHKGEILDVILTYAPDGKHYAFEPLPHLFDFLREKYKGMNISVFPLALFDKKGETTFNYVVSDPAYSGIRKRQYNSPDVRIDEMKVDTDLLDNIIPAGQSIDFIKIDVEGAEFGVMKGGSSTIKRCQPVIIFEFGLGAADYYGTKPEDLFHLVNDDFGMCLSTLKSFLTNGHCLDKKEFCRMYTTGKEYYFVAHRRQVGD
jgi:FkbM family methyltransferase